MRAANATERDRKIMKKMMKLVGSWGAVCAVIVAGLALAGCKSGPQFTDLSATPAATGPATGPATAGSRSDTTPVSSRPEPGPSAIDMINVGDTLTITFSDLPIPVPQWQDRVKEDGTITLIQNQTFTAAGKTRGQLEREIRKRYVPDIFQAMTVSVQQDYQHQFYTVRGEVKAPGRQVYLSRLTVLKAIGSAGDFTDFARKTDVILTRSDGQIHHINAKKALGDPTLDLEVFPGDVIYVPRRNPFW